MFQTSFQEAKEPVPCNQSSQNSIIYFCPKNGFEVPKNYANGLKLDNKNKNTNWQDVMEFEMKQLDDYHQSTT